MQLYSTNNPSNIVSLKQAVLKGLPEDKGLYMPTVVPKLPDSFFKNIQDYSFEAIGFEVCKALFNGYIPESTIKNIVDEAINFPAPVVKLDDQKHILELFHGPSLAFKDFGARFMSRLMSHFYKNEKQELIILVATSGDTGGAVAAGFYDTPGIQVVILYPSGKVSILQEKQLTTLGKNITALEVDGTFDDCQALVKQAFLDKELNQTLQLSSANSINISRLIPQSFYYFEAWKQLNGANKDIVFCIPSGNFGNLTAGLLAQKMGLPVHHFIAATNVNDVVPAYLQSGEYQPRPSIRTISNAMDVGNPSNFARMLDIYKAVNNDECSTWNMMKEAISGYAFTDEQTEGGVKQVKDRYDYTIDPHGAVGYLALEEYQKTHQNTVGVILETAHPSKFKDDMERILDAQIDVPTRLSELADLKKEAKNMSIDFDPFKDFLLETFK